MRVLDSAAKKGGLLDRQTGEIHVSHRKELWFDVPGRCGRFINITSQVEQALAESKIREGLVLVNAMHITASVFINDDESGLHHDYDGGWKNSPRTNRFPSTVTTGPARITPMRT